MLVSRHRSSWFGLGLALVGTLGGMACGPRQDDSGCIAGQAGCSCRPLGDCSSNLECSTDRICLAPHTTTLRVSGGGVRSCEVLLSGTRTPPVDVRFRPGVRGSFARRGDRTSIAFVSEADADTDGSLVEVRWLGGSSQPAFVVVESACFDRLGRSIAGSSVESN